MRVNSAHLCDELLDRDDDLFEEVLLLLCEELLERLKEFFFVKLLKSGDFVELFWETLLDRELFLSSFDNFHFSSM